MNDVCVMWNLPWQALQKDLALGLGADAFGASAAADRPLKPAAAVSTISWLSRARLRAVPRAQAPMRRVQAQEFGRR
jgi:hypothetical protein